MRRAWLTVFLVAVAIGSRAGAIDVADGRLTVGGFGQWGYGRTAGENAYFVGNEEGNYENAQFSLAVTAQPQDDVLVAGQIFFAPDGEVSLDWAFGEYRLHDYLRLRAGKVKNPMGIFMEVKDVGTLRPFFTLPHSIYGAGGFGAEAYLGAGITGEWQGTGWGIAYDLFGGAMEVPAFEPEAVLEVGPPPFDFSTVAVEEREEKDVVGGRLVITTPVTGLSFRLSGSTGEVEEGLSTERLTVYGVSAEYNLDRFQVRGEVFRGRLGSEETLLAGYAEVAWNVLPKLQVAVRFEAMRDEKEGIPDGNPLLRHTEGAVGLSYWPTPNLAFKTSYHRADGNRFAIPSISAADGSIDRQTDLFVAGAQFSF